MYRIILGILFSIFSLVTKASFVNLSGKVQDVESKEPIAFASVFFVDIDAGTTTNEKGEFNFSGNLPQNVKLKVSAIGYETTVLVIKDPNIEGVNIELHHAHMELNEVTVSTTTGVLQKHSITNIESRSVAELNTVLNSSLGEAIANIPSVYSASTGPGISQPVIRGLSGMRVVAYLNGLRLENQQWGGDHGMGVLENGIGKVEVIKGPSSLLYGADALGGVLYFTDEAYADQNTIESFVESQFETNSMRTKNFAGVKLSKKHLRINVFGSYNSNADYQLPNGKFATNSRFNERNLKTSIGYNKRNWVMNLRYNYMNNHVGLPGHTHDLIVTPESFQSTKQNRREVIPKQITENHFLLLENTFYFSQSDLKVWLGVTDNKITEHDEKVTIPGIEMTLQNNTYNARWRKNIGLNGNLIVGAQGMYQINGNSQRALEILIPNANFLDNGVYTMFKGEKGLLEYQVGVRYDNRIVNSNTSFKGSNPISKSFDGVNYSAGAVRTWEKFTLRTNVSSGFRPPHLSELLANGVHHGTLRYEVGNKDLKSEKATQFDVSVEYTNDHISLILNPFYNAFQNYIYIEPQDTDVEGFPLFLYKQISSAQLYGGDFGVHYHPHFLHQLHLEHNVSYLFAEDKQNNPLPLIPQTRFNSTMRFEFKSQGKVQLENLSVQHLYFLEQNRVVSYESKSPAYQLIHVGANLKLDVKTPISLKFGIRNLLNEAYIDHLSRLKNIGLEAPGRTYYVGARINLKHKYK